VDVILGTHNHRHRARFDWQKDDVLLVDNMPSTHGREVFTGPDASPSP